MAWWCSTGHVRWGLIRQPGPPALLLVHPVSFPRCLQDVVPFFESLGFKVPERKAVADFLQVGCSC